MPATAGRVRMPANNRVHSSAALQTHSIWQTAIGYDPYAPNNVEGSNKNARDRSSNMGMEAENAYASFQRLLAQARINGSNANEARGACKKCGRVGHLTFQCLNFLSTVKDDIKEKDPDAFEASVLSGLDKVKGNSGEAKCGRYAFENLEEKSSEEEEEDSESSDSDCDSEIERAIAEKNGNNVRSKLQYLRQKKEDFDEYNLVYGHKKKKGRSNKRSGKKERTDTDTDTDNEDEERSKRRKERRRRRRDESPDEDIQCRHRRRKSQKEKRKGSQRRSDDLVSEDSECFTRRHKRKGRRRAASPSFSDISSSEDSSVGRQKEVRKKMRRHHCEDDD